MRPPNDVATDETRSVRAGGTGGADAMVIPAAFYEAHRHEFLDFGEAFDVRLANGLAGRQAR